MSQSPSRARVLAIGATVLAVIAVGWSLVSHFAMDNSVPDAIGEALGMVLGLLVIFSIIGAVAGSARRDRRR